MDILRDPGTAQHWALDARRGGRSIALVPTMGALHEGHLSLMRMARCEADLLAVSIFVNPTQFGPGEDLASYPRDFAQDEERCRREGADAIFYPDAAAMYTDDHSVYVQEDAVSTTMEGASRPGHFRGVLTVVAKLLNIMLPDVAVFGQKDAQQLFLIKRMVRDLNFPTRILDAPIIREPDGLAMSSRNVYLDARQREAALCLKRALARAAELVAQGEQDAAVILRAMSDVVRETQEACVDYIEVVDPDTFRPVSNVGARSLALMAVRVGTTRLIDNAELISAGGTARPE